MMFDIFLECNEEEKKQIFSKMVDCVTYEYFCELPDSMKRSLFDFLQSFVIKHMAEKVFGCNLPIGG